MGGGGGGSGGGRWNRTWDYVREGVCRKSVCVTHLWYVKMDVGISQEVVSLVGKKALNGCIYSLITKKEGDKVVICTLA